MHGQRQQAHHERRGETCRVFSPPHPLTLSSSHLTVTDRSAEGRLAPVAADCGNIGKGIGILIPVEILLWGDDCMRFFGRCAAAAGMVSAGALLLAGGIPAQEAQQGKPKPPTAQESEFFET